MRELTRHIAVFGFVLALLTPWNQAAQGDDGAIQMTTDPTEDSFPDWSPDGSQIAFFSNRSGNRDIWVICVGGPSATEQSTWGHIKAGFKD